MLGEMTAPRSPAVPPTDNNEKPGAGSGGQVMQFNIDQLFAALGAKEFECTMLRGEVQKLQQAVATYRNIIAQQEDQKQEGA